MVGLAAAPLVAVLYRAPLGRALRVSVTRCSAGALLASMGLLLAKTYSGALDEMAVDDRGYRIAHNEGQLEVDRLCRGGAVAGLAAGALSGALAPGALLAFPLTGVALSVLGYSAVKLGGSERGRAYLEAARRAAQRH